MALGGIGDAIAALLAAAGTAAAASPLTASPDTNRIVQPAIDAGELGAEQCVADMHGQEYGPADPAASDSESARAEGTGRRPPDIELEIVIVGRPPAADTQSSAPGAPAPPAADPDGMSIEPSESPPDNLDPSGMTPEVPASEAPPPNAPFRFPVPADIADQWQLAASVNPPALGGAPFGITGEEFNASAKQAVTEFLTNEIHKTWEVDPNGDWSTPGTDAAILQTVADVAIDLTSVVVDPPFLVRGIMRLGSGSAAGVEKVAQGDTLSGSLMVIGEVSSAVLIVLAPVQPAPRTASITMYGPEALVKPNAVIHNVVKVEGKGRAMASDAVKEAGTSGKPVAMAKEYPLDTLAMKIEKYTSVTRAIPEYRATQAFSAMDRAHAGVFDGVTGGIGRYGHLYEHCSTYAATVSTAAGIPITGIFGPRITLLLFEHAPQFRNPTFPLITGGTGANTNSAAANGAP